MTGSPGVSHTEVGAIVLLTVRKGLTQFFESRKLRVRVDIAWPYTAEPDGMPDEETARLIEDIEPKLRRIMERISSPSLRGTIPAVGRRTGPSTRATSLPWRTSE